jgi:hypothetical protein
MSEFLTKAKFTKLVEETVATKQISYMEAILHLCEQYTIEPEDARKYISPVIKNKLEVEAMNLNFLPKEFTNTLDC